MSNFVCRVSVTSRNDSQLETLKQYGAKVLKLSFDDADKIQDAVFAHDAVVNAAPDNSPGALQAILKGIQKRIDAGKSSVYIHTSGAGVVCDLAGGDHSTDLIFRDDDPEHFERNVTPGSIHRSMDVIVRDQAKKWSAIDDGKTQVRIMFPPLIFGKGEGPFKDYSFQIPGMVRAGLAEGKPIIHGQGKNVTGFINVSDLADAYLILLSSLLKNGTTEATHPDDIYLFADGGHEVSFGEIARKVGQDLKVRGKVESATPVPLPEDTLQKYFLFLGKGLFGGDRDCQLIGGNVRTRAIKMQKLGWKPKQSTVQELLSSIQRDVDVVIQESTR
jgi:nucleoside-diphosphate-sugar epimerase